MPSASSFQEIRALTAALPAYDVNAREAARDIVLARHGRDYETESAIAGWLAGAQRRDTPSVGHPRIALFAAVHGIAADLALGAASALAADMAALGDGEGDLHRLIRAANTDLRLYELALHLSTSDSRREAAMRERDTAHAMAYGMMAIEPGLDAVVLAARGLGSEIAASAILFATSPDAGALHDAAGDRGREAALRHAGVEDPLSLLSALGGPDIAAMAGAILAARLAGVAIILDGAAAEAAGAIVKRLRPDGLDHCLKAGVDQEPPRAGLAAIALLRQACSLAA